MGKLVNKIRRTDPALLFFIAVSIFAAIYFGIRIAGCLLLGRYI